MEKDLVSPVLRDYLDASDDRAEAEILSRHAGELLYRPVITAELDETPAGAVRILLWEEEARGQSPVSFLCKPEELPFAFPCLMPGKAYIWSAEDAATGAPLGSGAFRVRDVPPRVLHLPGVRNPRDIGGWETEDGRRVKYGMVIRSGDYDDITDAGRSYLTELLGIRTELDLRYGYGPDNVYASSFHPPVPPARTPDRSRLSETIGYHACYFTQYTYIFDDFLRPDADFPDTYCLTGRHYPGTKEALYRIFTVLGDPDAYPVAVHCSAGADRTGTLLLLLNGLLGVPYKLLVKDFELTSFSESGLRCRSEIRNGAFTGDGVMQNNRWNYVAWGETVRHLMTRYGGTAHGARDGSLSSAVFHYLTSFVGVPEKTLETIRSLLLE